MYYLRYLDDVYSSRRIKSIASIDTNSPIPMFIRCYIEHTLIVMLVCIDKAEEVVVAVVKVDTCSMHRGNNTSDSMLE